ncbi:oleosin Cor a 15-like [Malania oleifera]|uniref:oleosin Cor a 15-like n=1 Tax=Malania oleifera TaxID=397392 RepID=UPI0025AEBEA7|nr:oleosin Cor a 15-like [Malania oleifera]
MAESTPPQLGRATEGIKSLLPENLKGPSTSQVLAVITLVPLGGFLLFLAGLTLTGTAIGLALTTPLFVIFSPVLIPAALIITLAVAGFLTSGAFGITAVSSLRWIVNYLRRSGGWTHAKQRAEEAAGHVGQKAKEVGHGALG